MCYWPRIQDMRVDNFCLIPDKFRGLYYYHVFQIDITELVFVHRHQYLSRKDARKDFQCAY